MEFCFLSSFERNKTLTLNRRLNKRFFCSAVNAVNEIPRKYSNTSLCVCFQWGCESGRVGGFERNRVYVSMNSSLKLLNLWIHPVQNRQIYPSITRRKNSLCSQVAFSLHVHCTPHWFTLYSHQGGAMFGSRCAWRETHTHTHTRCQNPSHSPTMPEFGIVKRGNKPVCARVCFGGGRKACPLPANLILLTLTMLLCTSNTFLYTNIT